MAIAIIWEQEHGLRTVFLSSTAIEMTWFLERDVNIKARNERVEQLKAQVNAGTYKVDSMALAQKMATAPGMQKLLSVGRYSLLDFGDEEQG